MARYTRIINCRRCCNLYVIYYYYENHKVVGKSVSDGSGRLIYGRLSCGWLGVVLARLADLSGRLGATGRCA